MDANEPPPPPRPLDLHRRPVAVSRIATANTRPPAREGGLDHLARPTVPGTHVDRESTTARPLAAGDGADTGSTASLRPHLLVGHRRSSRQRCVVSDARVSGVINPGPRGRHRPRSHCNHSSRIGRHSEGSLRFHSPSRVSHPQPPHNHDNARDASTSPGRGGTMIASRLGTVRSAV